MSPQDSSPGEDRPQAGRTAAREEFIAGVRAGFAQLDRGEGVPLEEVEHLLPEWQRQEMERRYAEYFENPDDGSSWNEVRERIARKLP
jgi:hypothetical protein